MPSDITIIAIVFALILLVVFFSAVILYLAFRIKETFSKETRRGATVVKVAFLIGILFLGGGIFYFAASTLANQGQTPQPTSSPSPSSSNLPSPSTTTSPPSSTPSNTLPYSPSPTLTASPTSQPTTSPSSPITPSSPPSPSTQLALNVAYPPTSRMNSTITITFTITNPTPQTAHSAVLQTNSLFQVFQLVSSSKPVVGNVIEVGDVPQGNTIVTVQLLSPRSGVYSDTIKLIYLEAVDQITGSINITIRGN